MPMGINTHIKWSMLELTGLLEDEDARVYFQRSKRHLGLHPFQLNDLKRALREILNAKVNFYDSDSQGLVLAYRNSKLVDSLGGILHDSHFIHVDIEADFYIFRPEIGCTLKGIANKKAGNHLGVLVHKAFNVSILKAEDCEEWLGDYVFVGQEVKFKVTHLDFKGKLPFIRGELIPDATMGRAYHDTVDDEEIEEKPRARLVADGNLNKSGTNAEESDPSSQTDDFIEERVKNEKSKPRKGKSTKKKVDRKQNTVDSESSSDDRDRLKKRASSTKKIVNEQIRKEYTDPDAESSSDDRDGIKEHGRITEKLSKIQRIRKLDSNGDCQNKKSRKSKTKSGGSGEIQNEEYDSSVELKPKVFRSVESISNKHKMIESTSKSAGDRVNAGSSEELDDVVTSPLRRSKKNRIADSDDGSVYELDEKPDIKVKKKKKKRDEEEKKKEKSPKKSKTHEYVETKVEKEEEMEKKRSKKKAKMDQSEMEETEIEEETKRSKKKSKSGENQDIVVKEETAEEKRKSSKKSKLRENESEENEATDADEEEKRRSKKKSKAKESENEAKAIKNEDEEERRRSRKKSKAKESENEAKAIKNEDEEERRRSKKKSKAEEVENEARKIKNEDEEETRRSKKKSNLKDKGEEIVKRDDDKEVDTEEPKKHKSTINKYKAEEEAIADEFDFIKPGLDKFDVPVAKSKRKRRKTLTNEEEPDTSEVEDSRPTNNIRKRRRSRCTNEEDDDTKRGEEQYENVRIKLEPNMSDVEDSKPSKKKSRRQSISENSCEIGKVKIEPDASDVESTNKAGRSIKCEPQETSKKWDGSRTIPV